MRVQRLYFIVLLTCIALFAKANPVDSVTAKTVAANFYRQNYKAEPVNALLAKAEKSSIGETEYYIYNIYPENSFVIVSADDAAHPIIGYSTEGYMPNSKFVSPEFSFFMQRYKKQVDFIRLNHSKASADIQNEWNTYKNNLSFNSVEKVTGNVVGPLVKTTWEQAPYSNAYCPDNCVAGCVATAMAQIMKYWSFPEHGIGSNSYSDSPYGTLYAVFDTTQYDWSAMPDNVTKSNQAVAILSYQCGVSVNMGYTPSSSGSYMITGDDPICAQTAFAQYFDYNGNTLKGLYMDNF